MDHIVDGGVELTLNYPNFVKGQKMISGDMYIAPRLSNSGLQIFLGSRAAYSMKVSVAL